jgi:hypothetical protein
MEPVWGNATLEVSTDLADWETLTNFTSPTVTICFEDLAATNAAQRYYRVVLP